MQRPGPAEGDQRVVARVMPALDADDADGLRHVGGDDRDDALRRRHQVEAEFIRQPADRMFRQALVDRHASAEQMRRVQGLEHDIGVGDGGFGRPRP